jgi:hypothetical protein
LDRQLTLVRVRQHFGNGYAILVLMQRPCVIAGEIALLTNQPRRATVRPPTPFLSRYAYVASTLIIRLC